MVRVLSLVVALAALSLIPIGVWGMVAEIAAGRWWMVFVIVPGQLAAVYLAALYYVGATEDRR